MKNLVISRGDASYKTRGLDTISDREAALQEDCLIAIKAMTAEVDKKSEAQKYAKILLSISASVHSDIERILRQHGHDC